MNILESKQLRGSKAQVLWIALPLAALMLTGCPIYTDNGHPLPCSATSPCPTNQMCTAGMCEAVICTTDSECPTGQHCDSGNCVAGERVCETHGDCEAGYMCDITATAGSCVVSTTCTSDATCATGLWCDFRDTCVPHNAGDCRTATDCTTAGDVCIAGSCQHLPATCQFEYDCPAGDACVNAQCTVVCHADGDCAMGDICDLTTHFCSPAANCATSATCPTSDHCVDASCLADCHNGVACATGSYCGTDQFCHPNWQPTVACTMDTDCATGRLCLSHVCRTPCPDGSMSQAAGDSQCSTIDTQVPHCMLDTASSHYLCNAATTSTASCRLSTDCTGTEQCVNAACQ